jgi:hypothetical protein
MILVSIRTRQKLRRRLFTRNSQSFYPLSQIRTVYRFMCSDSDLIETFFQFLQISLTAFLAFDDREENKY